MRREFAIGLRTVLAVATVLLVLGPAACSRRPVRPAAPVYPYKADVEKVFYATSSGLAETWRSRRRRRLAASKAPNASVLSSDGKVIAAAVNGWGLERVESSPDGSAYRLVSSPYCAGFAGLSTAGIWPHGGGFLVQLYRDPFADTAAADASPTGASSGAAAASASRLVFFGEGGAAATALSPFPKDTDAGFEAFALLPSDSGWFAELRKDGPERVDSKFFVIDDPLAAAPALREIRRADFESALAPLSLSSLDGVLGASLRSALGLLGGGPWLIRLRSGAGADRWYLSSGRAEDANGAFAWSFADGAAGILVMSPDGRLVLSDGGGAKIADGDFASRRRRELHGSGGGGEYGGGRMGERGIPRYLLGGNRSGPATLALAARPRRDTIRA